MINLIMDINTQPSAPVKRSSKGLLIAALSVVLLVAAVGAGVYYWQHQKVADLETSTKSLNTKVAALDKQLAAALSAQVTAGTDTSSGASPIVLSTDDQVITAVKNYCNANVDASTKKPLVLTVGTAGPAQKRVLYSSDKLFAYVNAVCSNDGTTEGSGAAYYLKKVNDTWVFLYRGQMASPDYTVQFNIPATFN